MALEGANELASELAAIKKGAAKPVYLLFGSEPYLVRTAASALIDALSAVATAEVVPVDAAGKSARETLAPLAMLSLFAPARIAVIRGFSHLLSGEEADVLLKELEQIAPPNAAVFLSAQQEGAGDSRVDKRVRGFKGISKIGAVLEFGTQTPQALAEWLRAQAAQEGKKLGAEAAQLLLDRVGLDMDQLRSELDKAILYKLGRETIDVKDIADLVGRTREEAVWEISEAVMRRDARRALILIEDQLAAGVFPLVLLTLLVRQSRHLLQARLLWEEAGRPPFRDLRGFQARFGRTLQIGRFGKGPDDVTTIHPFACFKRFEAAQTRDSESLRRMVARLRQGDRDAKSGGGAGAKEILEEIVLDLCALAKEAA
jgi:DNA polymerase-3 subunit delta